MAFLRTTLFSVCLSGAALPVLAQTAQPAADPPPAKAEAASPSATLMPDTGIKRTAPTTRTPHRTHHHVQTVKGAAPTTQPGE